MLIDQQVLAYPTLLSESEALLKLGDAAWAPPAGEGWMPMRVKISFDPAEGENVWRRVLKVTWIRGWLGSEKSA